MAETEKKPLQWPVSDAAELKRLKAEFARPVPRILFQSPPPQPHPDRPAEEYDQLVADGKARERLYAQRVVCKVSRLTSTVVNPRFQGIEIHPCGYPINVPQNKWIALPLTAVETLERAYLYQDWEPKLRKHIQPDTSTLGYTYKKYKVWEYRVERWDLTTGTSNEAARAFKPEPVEEEEVAES